MWINTELANKYQEFFNFMSQEHNLTLTISEMNDILSEAKKLESKLRQADVSGCVHPLSELVSGDEGLFCCKCQKYVRSDSHIH